MAKMQPQRSEQEKVFTGKTTNEYKSKPGQEKITDYMDDFNSAQKYVSDNYHTTWYDCWKIYNNKRVKIGYNSISDNFVPETRTIVESLVANIAGGTPKFEYIPTTEEQSTETKVLTELMNYYWDCNHMGTKAQSWVRDSILYGTGILHVTWDSDLNIPKIDNVPLRDFFVDPTSTCLEDARFAGFRYLGDKEAMKKMEVINPDWKDGDPEDQKYIKKYKNLESLDSENLSGTDTQQMDKAQKENLLGSTLGANNDRQLEIIIIYYMDEGKERIVEIANRTTVIREVDTPYKREKMERKVEVIVNENPSVVSKEIDEIEPFLPFAILRNTIDSSLFYGTGDVEILIDSQEKLNDVENLDMDNLHYINNVMWRIDPAYEDMAGEIESTPGIVIPIPRNALEPIQKPSLDHDLDDKKQEIKDEMRRVTAADEIMQGGMSQNSRTTATEVTAVTTQAMARFKTKVTNLESEGFAQLGSVLFKISQIMIDQATVVRIVGPEGVTFKDFDPYEFSGYYEPHVRLDSTVKQQKEERGMKDNQLFQLIIGNPAVNQQEAIRMVAKHLDADQEEINRLLDTQQMPGQMMPGAEATGAPTDPAAQAGAQGQPSSVDPEQIGTMAARADFAREQGILTDPSMPGPNPDLPM